MPEPLVLVAREGAVATITLNRPQALNALNRDLTLALVESVSSVEADGAIRCVVLRGGEHFMAGGDLKWFKTLSEGRSGAENRAQFEGFIHEAHAIILGLRRMPKPVIASVRGAVAYVMEPNRLGKFAFNVLGGGTRSVRDQDWRYLSMATGDDHRLWGYVSNPNTQQIKIRYYVNKPSRPVPDLSRRQLTFIDPVNNINRTLQPIWAVDTTRTDTQARHASQAGR